MQRITQQLYNLLSLVTLFFGLFSGSITALADDSEIFLGDSSISASRPQVMIVLDISTSMGATIGTWVEKKNGIAKYNDSKIYTGYYTITADTKTKDSTYQNFEKNPSGIVSKGGKEYYFPKLTQTEKDSEFCFLGYSSHYGMSVWRCQINWMNWKTSLYEKNSVPKIEVAKKTILDVVKDNPGMDFGLAQFGTSGTVIKAHLERNSRDKILKHVKLITQGDLVTSTPLCHTYYELFNYFSGKEFTKNNKEELLIPSDEAAYKGSKYVSPAKRCQNIYVIFMTDGEPYKGDPDNIHSVPHPTEYYKKFVNDHFKNNRLPDDHPAKNIANCMIITLGGESDEHCLPGLAKYLANPPENGIDNNPLTGKGYPKAITFTIGFETDQKLLSDTAIAGGGECYTTKKDGKGGNCTPVYDLASAFQKAILTIRDGSANFVTPTTSVNNSSRSDSLDSAYLAIFEPSQKPMWRGNIKKFKIHKTDKDSCKPELGTLLGRSCKPAFANGSTEIDKEVTSYWSKATADGSEVTKGGLDSVLVAQGERTIYTNAKTDSGEKITSITSDANPINLPPAQKNWVLGKKTNGKAKEWILGDIQHSQPVTLDYGAINGHSPDDPDIRLVFGTNHGFLHMIEERGDTADPVENWAFFAAETKKNLDTLITQPASASHPYGLDGEITVIRIDTNKDGSIKKEDGDRMIIIFGMRRGGTSYYALDVTKPNDPSLLWRIDHQTPGFEELGQSWAKPIPIIIPGHRKSMTNASNTTTNRYHYALAISGGYDGADDASDNQGKDDVTGSTSREHSTRGRGIYIVDAGTGELIKAFVASGTKPLAEDLSSEQKMVYKNVEKTDLLKWSIPAPATAIHTNNDGLHDLLYLADSGGNVFRIDILRKLLDNGGEEAEWSLIKLASLGIDEKSGSKLAGPDEGGDRRFFYQPSVSLTKAYNIRYNAVAIGSGNRANPVPDPTSGDVKSVVDRYYMIRDTHINPTVFRADCATGDTRCAVPPAVIKNTDLYDTTLNHVQQSTGNQKEVAENRFRDANTKGWYINFLRINSQGNDLTGVNDNEMTISPTNILPGAQLTFATYSPAASESQTSQVCVAGAGTGRKYVINLHNASAVVYKGDNPNMNSRVPAKFSGLYTGGSYIPLADQNGNTIIKDITTGETVDAGLGMHRSGWLQVE